jgi:phospholipid/cholesterol/gamma-HCH transport system ATP-binding protein
MLEIRNISKEFAGKSVLHNISLSIPKESIVFVLGKSGVGKSVLLKTIVGLIPQDKGSIWIDEVETQPRSENEMVKIRKKCGLVFQMPALIDSMTVEENLVFAVGENHELDLRAQLSSVGLESSCLGCYPLELSIGAQKKVSFLRTVLLKPDYLLFDEPTTGLDPVSTQITNQIIRDAAKERKAGCLVVSHDVRSAFKLADRIVLLDAGRIVFNGSPGEFQKSEVPLVQEFLKGTVFLD